MISIRPRPRALTAVLVLALGASLASAMTSVSPAAAADLDPENAGILVDFEGGAPPNFFVSQGVHEGGAGTVTTDPVVLADDDEAARPGQVGDNEILAATFDIPAGGWGSIGATFDEPLDLRGTDGFRVWLHGEASGAAYQLEIMASRSDPTHDTSERFDVDLVDDHEGWRLIEVRWEDFTRATDWQPDGAPGAGLTLEEIWGWAIPFVSSDGPVTFLLDDLGAVLHRIDDFEEPLFSGTDGNGLQIGFGTFNDGASSFAMERVATPPGPVLPHLGHDNHVLGVDANISAWAGFVHNFTDGSAWVPQDWSAYSAFGFWFHGEGTGTTLFVDVLGERNPGSTTDDAQRWTTTFVDDTPGWRFVWFPFDDLAWKQIGNGAPTGDLTLLEVNGWAFGVEASGGPVTFHLDDVVLLGSAGERPLTVGFGASNTTVDEGGTANVPVRLSRPLDEDAEPVTVTYATERGTGLPDRDYVETSGQLVFEPGGPIEQSFPVETIDDHKPLGDRTAVLRLTSAEGAPLRTAQARVTIRDTDPVDPASIDDFERGVEVADGMHAQLSHLRIVEGDDLARPEQAPVEGVLRAEVAEGEPLPDLEITKLSPCQAAVWRFALHGSDTLAVAEIDHATVRVGDASEMRLTGRDRSPKRQVEDVDGDGHDDLVVHVRRAETGLACGDAVSGVTAATFEGGPVFDRGPAPVVGGLSRVLPEPRDLSGAEGIGFWFRGSGSGEDITFRLLDDRAPDPGPDGWELVWSDEFDGPEGSLPNPDNWSFEIGDGTANGIPGWGNDELQYYTDDPANVRHDGDGHLVIEVLEEDGDLPCYYGDCRYSSARLITQHKQEFMFGRVEARVQVPFGDGLWPAFWALGTDIGEVGWPQTGEIDVMEYVGRLPNTVFGTVHGPGYSGGNSVGGTLQTDDPVEDDFHDFAVEWRPGFIAWEFDGHRFFEATPDDVPGEWVFDHPFFLLLNVAVGGNFGGPVGPDTTFPQRMLVDHVRVYSAPDTSERFETTFVDDVDGWRFVEVPFDQLERSDDQPDGAPDTGLNLTEVWGYEVLVPGPATFHLDDVRVLQAVEVAVTTTADSGPGSLRAAVANVGPGGTIRIDPALAGETVALTSGALQVDTSTTIDATGAPGFTVDAGGASRLAVIGGGANVGVEGVTFTGGSHASRGGALLVNGSLELVDVAVRDSSTAGDPGAFEDGGGGIYVAQGGSLSLTDVSLDGNSTAANGGALWAGFDSEVTIERSTVSGNTAGNVGGGLRTLGNVVVVNSTLSGNAAGAWHGSALFHTDGVARLLSTTVTDNTVPDPGFGALLVANFGAPATLEIGDSAIDGGNGLACQAEGGVTLTSLGGNVVADGSCQTGADDTVVGGLALGGLADNGGPTPTHLPAAGSPVLDAADSGRCPDTDQRGIERPQGAGCDAGAVELEP